MTQHYERSIGGETERMLAVEGSPHCYVTSRFGRSPTSSCHPAEQPDRLVEVDLQTAQRQAAQRYRAYVEDPRDEEERRKLMSGD